jgi:hypothetical protein
MSLVFVSQTFRSRRLGQGRLDCHLVPKWVLGAVYTERDSRVQARESGACRATRPATEGAVARAESRRERRVRVGPAGSVGKRRSSR